MMNSVLLGEICILTNSSYGVSASSQNVEHFEILSHTFIIKLWIEEPPDPGERLQTGPEMESIEQKDVRQESTSFLRGRITHVPSGQIRHFEESDEMLSFIQTFLTPFLLRRSRRTPVSTSERGMTRRRKGARRR